MNDISKKIHDLIYPLLFAVIVWFIKLEISRGTDQMSEMANTLKQIRSDVESLNRDSMLFKQKINFRFEMLKREVDQYHK